MRKQRLLNPVL